MNDLEISKLGLKNNGHGGARRGAGTKPKGYVKPEEVQDYDKARARLETAKADKAELDYKIASGEYVSRAAVRQASATALQALSQTLRSVQDNLERQGVSIDIAELVNQTIEASLAEVADEFERMAGEEPS